MNGAYVLGSYSGYAVSPGKYKAQLKYKKEIVETSLTVLPNPNIKAMDVDWQEQQLFLENITAIISNIHITVNQFREIKKQLQYYSETLGKIASAKVIVNAADSLIKKIDQWESAIIESRTQNGQDVINWPSKLNVEFFYLKGLVDISDPKVTQGVKNKFADLQLQWQNEKSKLQGINTAVAEFNALYKTTSIEAIQNK